jgi:hypothetical protein
MKMIPNSNLNLYMLPKSFMIRPYLYNCAVNEPITVLTPIYILWLETIQFHFVWHQFCKINNWPPVETNLSDSPRIIDEIHGSSRAVLSHTSRDTFWGDTCCAGVDVAKLFSFFFHSYCYYTYFSDKMLSSTFIYPVSILPGIISRGWIITNGVDPSGSGDRYPLNFKK